jgi:RNA polymerase sigma-70 factor (ECF subfamily)
LAVEPPGSAALVGPPNRAQFASGRAGAPSVEEAYDEHFEFVWRSLRALGLSEAEVEDALQDVFLTAHRRLGTFEARSEFRTWLYGIARHVARSHRRRRGRKESHLAVLPEGLVAPDRSPDEQLEDRQAWALVEQFLDRLDESHREVFVLCELEQLPAPEVAVAVGAKLNTVYSRLRAARQAFQKAIDAAEGRES